MGLLRIFYALQIAVYVALTAVVEVQAKVYWSEPYKAQLEIVSKDPDTVVKALASINEQDLLSKPLRAQHHYTLSRANYVLNVPERAMEHASIALSLIDSQDNPWLFHRIRLAESLALVLGGQPASGLVGANAALVWGELQQDRDLIVNALYARGVILNSMADYHGALRDLQRAYGLAPNIGVRNSKGAIAGLIARVYEHRREDKLSTPFFEEAVHYHRLHENWLELSIALYGLGRANKNLGKINLAIAQLRESARIARQVNDKQGVAYAIQELGSIDTDRNKFALAQALLTEALSIFEQTSNQPKQLDAVLSLAVIALKKAQIDDAEHYLNLAQGYVDPETMPLQKIRVDERHAELLALKNDYKEAFNLLLKTIPDKQKIFDQRSTEQLHSLRAQYEINARDRENELLEQQNLLQRENLKESQTRFWQLMLLFAASLIISTLLIVLVYRTKQNRARFEKLANTDSLTGLNNRRRALELLETQVDLATRHDLNLAVAIADLDHFKKINDQHGHAAGDRVLKMFGHLCRETFRHTDIVGRIGGEEFIIALPMTCLEDARQTLKSLSLKVCELSNNLDIDGLQLSISCGVAVHNGQIDVAELMLRADNALYKAKENGRNRVETFGPD